MSDEPLSERWRTAARTELDRHWRAGTLSPADHEARTAKVRSARTTRDLDDALTGLPELPDDSGMVRLGDGASRPPTYGSDPGPAQAPRPGRDPRPVRDSPDSPASPAADRVAWGLVSAIPLLCLVLFFVLPDSVPHKWLVWLLIPLVAIIARAVTGRNSVYGYDGPGRDRSERRERRRERRDC